MIEIQRSPGQGIQIGTCLLQVLAVDADTVVVAIFDPDKDCGMCGERPAARRCCPICETESTVCPVCARSWQCPGCACPVEFDESLADQ
jgi:hypothetical protein